MNQSDYIQAIEDFQDDFRYLEAMIIQARRIQK